MAGLIVVGLVVATGVAIFVYQYGLTDRAQPADVIIVLGAGTHPDGTPIRAQIRRVRHAVILYQRGLAPYFLCTGGFTNHHPVSEAQSCVDLALQLGVPAGAILREDISTNTVENVIESKKVMAARSLRTALVVSDNFHLFRSEWLFREYGIPVSVSPAQSTQGPLSLVNAMSATYREVGALVLNFYRVNFTDYRLAGKSVP